MKLNNKNNIICFSIGILLIIYLALALGGGWWADLIYSMAVGAHQELSPEIYRGLIEERFLGPLKMVISGAAFLLLSLNFLVESRRGPFIIAVFFYLLLTRLNILFWPPYGDSIAGPFAEAIWLKNHGFNYIELSQQPGYIYGGPKVYLSSIYPTSLAILMMVIPDVKVFLLLNHLMVFLFGAITIALVRDIVLEFATREIALLVALVVLALPLFQAQVESINMEIPLVLFSVWTVYYLIKKNIPMASVMAALAVAIKVVAAFLSGIVLVIGIILFSIDQRYRSLKKVVLPLVLLMAFTLGCWYSFVRLSSDGKPDMVGPFQGWHHIKTYWETYLFIISSILLGIVLVKEKLSEPKSWIDIFKKHSAGLMFFLLCAGWFASFLNSLAGFPRYKLLLMPFIVLFVFYTINVFITSEKFTHRYLLILIPLLFLGSYGMLETPQEDKDYVQDHVILERSLEYRNDMELHLRIAEEIENKFLDHTIGAPFLVAQSLAIPELGYVTKKLDVMIYGFPCTYGGIKPFKGLKNLDLARTVWVGLKQELPSYMNIEDFPVSRYDKEIETIRVGRRWVTLFMGGMSIEKMRLVSRAVLMQLQSQGRLKNPYEHNFGLTE